MSIQCLNLCGDWTQYKDKKCFKVLNKTATRGEALRACLQFNKDSTLFLINDGEEQQFLNKLVEPFADISMNAWIGMTFFGRGLSQIRRMDGTDSDYTNWSEDLRTEGRDPCVIMSLMNRTLGKWTDSSCKEQALIVCQTELSLNSMKDNIEDKTKTTDKSNIGFEIENYGIDSTFFYELFKLGFNILNLVK